MIKRSRKKDYFNPYEWPGKLKDYQLLLALYYAQVDGFTDEHIYVHYFNELISYRIY